MTGQLAADITVGQFWMGLAAVLVALILIATFIEKVGQPVGRFLRHVVTDPLSEQLGAMATYVGHHLGPNGTTTPLHERVEGISRHQREDRQAIEELRRKVDELAERQKKDITAMALTKLAEVVPLREPTEGESHG